MGEYSTPRAHGYAIWHGDGRPEERDCLQCCHCGMQFYVTPHSGKKRGYCMRCNQVTCGAQKCDNCIHWKKKLELVEQGKADISIFSTGKADGLPVSVSVPSDLPRGAK